MKRDVLYNKIRKAFLDLGGQRDAEQIIVRMKELAVRRVTEKLIESGIADTTNTAKMRMALSEVMDTLLREELENIYRTYLKK